MMYLCISLQSKWRKLETVAAKNNNTTLCPVKASYGLYHENRKPNDGEATENNYDRQFGRHRLTLVWFFFGEDNINKSKLVPV